MDSASKETFVDFVAVGNTGADFSNHRGTKYLGSVADEVIRHTKLNVLFVAS
jgi:nucleotide-binding universal stress UspA family protein